MRSIPLGPETGRELRRCDLTEREYRRFWTKFQVGGDGCWLWTAGTFEGGYGRFELGGKYVFAHRLAFALTHGVVPAGVVVRHSCDVPRCVRVSHLLLGTQLDNIQDTKTRGRLRNSRLASRTIPDDVFDQIKHSSGPVAPLARQLGVSKSYAHYIRKGQARPYDERRTA